MNRPDTYLLTGANGFVARAISKKLMEKGYKVTGLGLSNNDINVDITNPFALDSGLKVDTVVHAAGKAHIVPKSSIDDKAFYDVNFEGTKNLVSALQKIVVRPKALIFISTVAVYGLDSGTMIPETHALGGNSPYAKSKIMAEQWLREWAYRNSIILGIVRLPLVAGPNPPGNLGAMIKGIRSGSYLSVGGAECRKSIVWNEDIASVFPMMSKLGGTFNLTDGLHPTFSQLEATIAMKLGKRMPRKIPLGAARILAFAGDFLGSGFPINSNKLQKITSSLTFDDSRAREFLGWKPSSVLDKLSTAL